MLKDITDTIEYERQLLENILCEDDELSDISRRLLDIIFDKDEECKDHVTPPRFYKVIHEDQTTE
jgi:hypothetical protein